MEPLLLEFAVRAALIAAGTAAVLRILRVRMAAAQHSAWAGVVVLMLLLPSWTAWGPKASWRVLPAPRVPLARHAAIPALAFSQTAPPDVKVSPAPPRRPVWNWRAFLAGIYLLGVFILLARLAAGTVRARMLIRRSSFRDGRLTGDWCAAPITVGWLTPTVILPECWRRWPQAQLDAVLTHESEHARRRDPLVQWLALLNRAVFWFHPLAWWLERRLSALAEEACDAAVLARGCDPFEYSEYLLEIARSVVQTGARVKALGMAMPGNCLPRRIRRILEGRPVERISRMRMACMAAACAMASAVFMAGAVDRQRPVVRVDAPVVAVTIQEPAAPTPIPVPSAPHSKALPAMIVAQVQAPATPAQEDKYKDKRLLVLYFDLSAMPMLDRARAFAAAQEFVRTKMQTNDLLAILTANDNVKVIQDFTGDRDRLLLTLDGLVADSGPESGAVDVERQLTQLHTAVNMLSSLQGKKAVVYFATAGFRSDSAELRPLIDAAIRANVAFYSIDARGMTMPIPVADKAYIIAAEDVLQIRVNQQQGITGRYTIRPDGAISMPMIGSVRAAGLTTAQLEAVISDRLEANGIVSNAAVTVSVAEVHKRQ